MQSPAPMMSLAHSPTAIPVARPLRHAVLNCHSAMPESASMAVQEPLLRWVAITSFSDAHDDHLWVTKLLSWQLDLSAENLAIAFALSSCQDGFSAPTGLITDRTLGWRIKMNPPLLDRLRDALESGRIHRRWLAHLCKETTYSIFRSSTTAGPWAEKERADSSYADPPDRRRGGAIGHCADSAGSGEGA